MNTELLFDIIEKYAPLIPLSIFLFKRGKRSSWAILLCSYLITYFFFLSIYNVYIYDYKSNRGNNIVVYIVVAILTFCFFALILEQFLQKNNFRIINRAVIVIAVLFFISNALWWEGTSTFNSNSAGLGNFILVCYCLYYYKSQLENPKNFFITRQASFWIVSGIFIYGAGNFFLFTMYKVLTKESPAFAYYSWYVNDIFILMMNIFFAKGLQCNWAR